MKKHHKSNHLPSSFLGSVSTCWGFTNLAKHQKIWMKPRKEWGRPVNQRFLFRFARFLPSNRMTPVDWLWRWFHLRLRNVSEGFLAGALLGPPGRFLTRSGTVQQKCANKVERIDVVMWSSQLTAGPNLLSQFERTCCHFLMSMYDNN